MKNLDLTADKLPHVKCRTQRTAAAITVGLVMHERGVPFMYEWIEGWHVIGTGFAPSLNIVVTRLLAHAQPGQLRDLVMSDHFKDGK